MHNDSFFKTFLFNPFTALIFFMFFLWLYLFIIIPSFLSSDIAEMNYFYYENDKKVQADTCYVRSGNFICEKDGQVFRVDSFEFVEKGD